MDRINGADWIDIGGGKRGFQAQNAGAGIEGTEVTATWLNTLQEEIAKVIETNGMALNPADSTQLWQMLAYGNLGGAAIGVRGYQSAPPGAPAQGDRYLVLGPGTGAWAGFDNRLAVFLGGGWVFFSPRQGQTVSYWSGALFIKLFWSGGAWIDVFRDMFSKALKPSLTTFTASGSWNKPAGLVFAKVRLVGAGGGGGLSTNNVAGNFYGGGGGNGGYGEAIYLAGALSATEAVTIGAGGTGRLVASGAGAGTTGGFSSFGGLIQANGGVLGTGGGGVSGAGGVGGTVSGALYAIQGTRGADGFEIAGVTFPSLFGDFGRGGQGGYNNTSTGSSANANNGIGGCLVVEEYKLA